MNTQNKTSVATLAGGCFWGLEDIIRKIDGVMSTEVGYSGGDLDNPTYEDLKTGKTGHSEAIQIDFDENQLSFENLLNYFFRMHDPTSLNRQGGDIGTQYRSAIFYHNIDQKNIARKVISKVETSGRWTKKIVTEVVELKKFYSAEEYHQDYLVKNPGGYTCHYLRD